MTTNTIPPIPVEKPVSVRRRVLRRVRYIINLLLFFCLLIYLIISVASVEIFTRSVNRSPSVRTPADYGQRYEEVSFPAAEDKLTIRGWFVPTQSERVIIALHGKGTSRAAMLDRSMYLATKGYNLLLIDMRGHGTSDGSNFSYGYYEPLDVLGAVAYLKGRGFKPEHIGILAHSMGAAVGLLAMGRSPEIKAMVSDSAYATLDKELEYALPISTNGLLPPFFLPGMLVSASVLHGIDVNKVRPVEAIKKLNGRHVLLIQGDRDELVFPQSIYQLKAAAGDAAEMWVIAGAGHNNGPLIQPQEYPARVLAFFKRELA